MTFNGGRAICPNVTVMSLSTGERHSNDASLELIIGKNERNVGVLCPDVGVVFNGRFDLLVLFRGKYTFIVTKCDLERLSLRPYLPNLKTKRCLSLHGFITRNETFVRVLIGSEFCAKDV